VGPDTPSDRRGAGRLPAFLPLSTGHPGPSQVVAPRRRQKSRPRPAPAGPGTRSASTGARRADPGQPGHGVAPS